MRVTAPAGWWNWYVLTLGNSPAPSYRIIPATILIRPARSRTALM